MVKTICVSMPDEDKKFCTSRALSPSKLLQERITQIRDENNPSLVKHLATARKDSDNMRRKVEFMAARVQKIFDGLQDKLTPEQLDSLIQNI